MDREHAKTQTGQAVKKRKAQTEPPVPNELATLKRKKKILFTNLISGSN